MAIHVGCGSWADAEYTGVLYPKGTPPNKRLSTYAKRFDYVELNASHHATPSRERVAGWVEQTPANFIFDFKLHKVFSEDPESSARGGTLVTQFLESAKPIIDAGKFGTFFLLMFPKFTPKRNRLEELDALVEKVSPYPLSVELRNNAWIEGDQGARTFDFFRSRKLVWIGVDMPRIEGSTLMPPIDEVTNPRLAYLRLHGRRSDWRDLKTQEERHTYEYSAEELNEITARVRALAAKAENVHVVANNHAKDLAPKTAIALQASLGLGPKSPDANGGLLPGF